MKTWKRKWRYEIDSAIPELRAEILNLPIPERENAEKTVTERKPFKFAPKFYAFATAAFAVILTVCLTLIFTLGKPSTIVTPVAANYAALIEINPKAMFSVNKEGEVTAVIAINEDADVILSSKERLDKLKGVKIEQAVETFVDFAAKLGYLDVNGKTAVKVSHCGNDSDSQKIVGSVEHYFKTNGIYSVVFAEKVTPQKIGEIAEIGEVKNADEMANSLNNLPELYSVRQSENKELDELQEMYKETVVQDGMDEVVIKRFEKMLQMDKDIDNVNSINDDIMGRADNPLKELGELSNYWWVKSNCNGDYSEFTNEFKTLMLSMDEALKAYKINYGKEIVSYSDFLITYAFIKMIDFESMKKLYDSMSTSEYLDYFPTIKDFLGTLGEDVSVIEKYLEVPQTKEEYLDKKNGYLSDKYDLLEQENEEKYNVEREEISDDEYSTFLDEIVEEYGSIENYWKSF